MESRRLDFSGASGAKLSARLDLPAGKVRAYALFAHCFTCSKDLGATRRIAGALAAEGIAVLRFDFTGLGSSEGEFASTNFSSNIADLVAAADMLREQFEAPSLLIGHSLGGAAALAAGSRIPEIKAVVTIGAPADAGHVVENFAADLGVIREKGAAEVSLAGRKFTITSQFLDDLERSSIKEAVAGLKRPLLIFHAPLDQTVGIENASAIFTAAKHPKSFISLDDADHLLTRAMDADFVAQTISAWSQRYLPEEAIAERTEEHAAVVVEETGEGKFRNAVWAGSHHLTADEPRAMGGTDAGPTPYDFLSIALGACTNMTIRMYADRKGWDIGLVSVTIDHDKIHARDCEECAESVRQTGGRIDQFSREIAFSKELDEDTRAKLLEIADKCPVHKTLHQSSVIRTRLA